MIFDAIIQAIMWINFTLIIAVMPNVGAAPQAMQDAGNWFTTNLANGIDILYWLLSPELGIAMATTIFAIYAFEFLYHPIMWVLRKLPLGID